MKQCAGRRASRPSCRFWLWDYWRARGAGSDAVPTGSGRCPFWANLGEAGLPMRSTCIEHATEGLVRGRGFHFAASAHDGRRDCIRVGSDERGFVQRRARASGAAGRWVRQTPQAGRAVVGRLSTKALCDHGQPSFPSCGGVYLKTPGATFLWSIRRASRESPSSASTTASAIWSDVPDQGSGCAPAGRSVVVA